jgi:hypothetical protein
MSEPSESAGNVVDIARYLDRREQEAKWREVAELIASDEVAVENFRTLMERLVGHPDESKRVQEGLPPLTCDRYGQIMSYPTEVCAVIDDRGNVLYVREIDVDQRWQEDVHGGYSYDQIIERGKNHFAATGNLFRPQGVQRNAVAQSKTFGPPDHRIHKLQILPEYARSQPYLPIYGDMRDLPWQVSIIADPGEVSVFYWEEEDRAPYRPIDGAFVDLIAEARMRQNQSQDALSC